MYWLHFQIHRSLKFIRYTRFGPIPRTDPYFKSKSYIFLSYGSYHWPPCIPVFTFTPPPPPQPEFKKIQMHWIICTYICTCFSACILIPSTQYHLICILKNHPDSNQNDPKLPYNTNVCIYMVTKKIRVCSGSGSKIGKYFLTWYVKTKGNP